MNYLIFYFISLVFSVATSYDEFTVQGINIDLPPQELAIAEIEYYSTSFQSNQNLPKVVKYESYNRTAFTVEKMKYIINKNPRSIVIFHDSNTILVPDDDILNTTENQKNEEIFNFIEVSMEDIQSNSSVILETAMIPATGCLSFTPNSKVGSGFVSISYTAGINLKQKSGTNFFGLQTLLSITYAINKSVFKAASYSGTHRCNTEKGKSVRLFYRIFTFETSPRYRGIVFDTIRERLLGGNWLNMETKKFLFGGHAPLYYCGTSDHMDLRCNTPGLAFIDSNGNEIEYLIDNDRSQTIFYY